MRIDIIGGGPGGLYFALLMKKADPAHEITVIERNQRDDTFGFGVVFSDETLDHVLAYDTETYREITNAFAYWDQIEVHYKGEAITSGGHGFCGMSRITLLQIFQRRCESLGVRICYQEEVTDFTPHRRADLMVGADGVNSQVRETYQERFQPRIDVRKTKFVWLGTTRTFGPFTFFFKANEHGWFYVHAYQYARGATTWIVECHEETWRKAGLDQGDEAATIAYCEKLFAEELQGHRLLSNRSLWRNFPMVSNEHLQFENVVLLGDAAHTAQFSIGSGTKIALEDAIALFEAFQQHPVVADALTTYEDIRRDEVGRLQASAYTSLQWYENARRYHHLEPQQFVFNFLARTKSMTYDALALRDPGYVAGVTRWFAQKVREEGDFDLPLDPPPPPMFTPFRLRGLTLPNRVVVSPMCQYSAREGAPNDWHLVHLGALAVGGAGLLVTEMTDVSAEGRITPGCAGMYTREHMEAWRRIVAFVHANSRARFCMQLAHAGRKAATRPPWEGENEPLADGSWPIMAASPIPYKPHSQVPREMERGDMEKVLGDFTRSARWAVEAGFDMVELHMAHGYLLSGFISPLTNHRQDAFGGSLANRMRFPLEVLAAVREVLPEEMPLSVRISATDWVEDGGLDGDDAVEVARLLHAGGCDIIDVSAGQTTTQAKPIHGRMFQTPFSDQIRHEAGVPTISVGNITTADQVNTIIAAGRADLCALARPHLTDPHFTLRAAAQYGYQPQVWPKQYLPAQSQAARVALAEHQRIAELRLAARPSSHRQRED